MPEKKWRHPAHQSIHPVCQGHNNLPAQQDSWFTSPKGLCLGMPPNQRNALLNAREGRASHLWERRKSEKGERWSNSIKEIKAFIQCKVRLLPSIESTCSMSLSVLSFTNEVLAVLLLHTILSLDLIISFRKRKAKTQWYFLVTLAWEHGSLPPKT